VHSVDFYEENANGMMLEQFVIEYQPLVKKIALYIKHRLPSYVGIDDLMQSGFVGLIEARNNYKNNLGDSFETYVSIRIRGSIMDALRKSSWSTRESSRNMRKISDAITMIEQRGQKQPTS
jgi:RNA polymerase sigma factor for flagellar operon FliA